MSERPFVASRTIGFYEIDYYVSTEFILKKKKIELIDTIICAFINYIISCFFLGVTLSVESKF